MKHRKKRTKNKLPKAGRTQYMDGLRQKALDARLPGEAVFRESMVTVVGHCELWIENYKALLEYGECEILIQAGDCLIRVQGERLRISHYMEEHMMICGSIRNITYM